MKKRIVGIAIAVLGFIGFGLHGESLNHYKLNATVCGMDSNEVFFEDEKGDIWGAYADGYEVGEKVVLRMHTNYTESVYDDAIKSIKRL